MRVGLLLCLLMTGCIAGEQIGSLREGMSQDEVVGVLGRPNGFERIGSQVGYQYTNRLTSGWGWDRADYFAIFDQDKLVRWGAGEVRASKGPNVGTLMVMPVR